MFLFLLNSSGAVILFVYLLIAVSQIVLRRRTPPEKLRVKMWLFPVLSILTAVGIVAVLVQMAFDAAARSQLWLSLLSWVVVLAVYFLAPVVRRNASGAESDWRTQLTRSVWAGVARVTERIVAIHV